MFRETSAAFREVADAVFVADILPAATCRDVLCDFADSVEWSQAKIALAERDAVGAIGIVGVVNTDRRNASRIRLEDTDMRRRRATLEALSLVQDAAGNFASTEFGMELRACDSAEIVRYPDGGEFKPHTDTHKDNSRRALTVIVYLNDDFKGGETAFPDLDYAYSPRRGSVMVFPSTLLHASLPVRGEKSILVFWISYPRSKG